MLGQPHLLVCKLARFYFQITAIVSMSQSGHRWQRESEVSHPTENRPTGTARTRQSTASPSCCLFNSPRLALPAAYSTVHGKGITFPVSFVSFLNHSLLNCRLWQLTSSPKSEVTLQSEGRITSLCFGFTLCVQHSMAQACWRSVVPATGKASPCWSKGDGWYPRGNFWVTENMKEDTFCRLLI